MEWRTANEQDGCQEIECQASRWRSAYPAGRKFHTIDLVKMIYLFGKDRYLGTQAFREEGVRSFPSIAIPLNLW